MAGPVADGARLALILVVVAVCALFLPRLWETAFGEAVAPTHLLYSPVRDAFVFREHHGHHDFVYGDTAGDVFDREAFERSLPFIYHRNMAVWGLLPVEIDGRTFDTDAIRQELRVLQLKPRELQGRSPAIAVHPLLESRPGRARLVFPEDVFRMTADRMEFLNVDTNTVDERLTRLFTEALVEAGFRFPARLIEGKPTILKPYDAGWLMVDATGAVFHVVRADGLPQVVRTSIPANLGIRALELSEAEDRRFLGLLVTADDRIALIRQADYGLVFLPAAGYAPERMDYKVVFTPLHRTVVYGDDAMVTAVAMTRDFVPIARHTRAVPGAGDMLHARVARALFPFTLSLEDPTSGFLRWRADHHGWSGLIGTAGALVVLAVVARVRRWQGPRLWPDAVLVAAAGVFGLIAALAVPRTR